VDVRGHLDLKKFNLEVADGESSLGTTLATSEATRETQGVQPVVDGRGVLPGYDLGYFLGHLGLKEFNL
jgi:hypothetical protein